ncbi:MAG TPA: SURF1 family protein [Alphaproteobacteria bacterium]|nr:SURF1 family protein [Alphaproteobacteria bacterium]
MARFQPRFWPTVIMLTMMAMVIGLGTWQLHRRVWKTELLATIAQRMNGDAVALPAAIDNPPDWTFRHVTVDGRFDQSYALWLYGRTFDGKAGVHLLVPLIRDTGDAILVDRGFVPFDHGNELARFAEPPATGAVDGIVRAPEPGGLFMPSSQPDRNIWYTVDIAAMSKAVGMKLAPVYIAARPSGDAAGWPAATGGTEGTGIRNEHLNYAIFWYSMAVVLAGIYVISSRSRPTASKTE